MNVQQLSIFIENKAGRLTQVSEVVAAAGVNIRGFSVSDTAGFGIVRLIVDDPKQGRQALMDAGFTVKTSDVLCIDLPDDPGGLASVLRIGSNFFGGFFGLGRLRRGLHFYHNLIVGAVPESVKGAPGAEQ